MDLNSTIPLVIAAAFLAEDEREQRVDKAKRGTLYPRKMKHSMIQVVKPVGPSSPFFRSTLDRFQDVSSYRKGRCRREENDYRDLGPNKYDQPSFLELQQMRSKTAGSIPGGSSSHRSTVSRKGSNWFPGKEEYPYLESGLHHQVSSIFYTREEAIRRLPGSRKGSPCFLNCGRSKVLMGDAIRFKTMKDVYSHLGPGSYDIPSTLTNRS